VFAVFFSDSAAVIRVDLAFFGAEVVWAWEGSGGVSICSFSALSGFVGIVGGTGAFLIGFSGGGEEGLALVIGIVGLIRRRFADAVLSAFDEGHGDLVKFDSSLVETKI